MEGCVWGKLAGPIIERKGTWAMGDHLTSLIRVLVWHPGDLVPIGGTCRNLSCCCHYPGVILGQQWWPGTPCLRDSRVTASSPPPHTRMPRTGACSMSRTSSCGPPSFRKVHCRERAGGRPGGTSLAGTPGFSLKVWGGWGLNGRPCHSSVLRPHGADNMGGGQLMPALESRVLKFRN